jgi:thymidine phosphorylase
VPAPALQSGYAASANCREIGLAVVSLGGGRRRAADAIDYAVGLTDLVGLGDKVEAGQPLAMVHARTQEAAEQAIREIQAAYQIADAAPAPTRSSTGPFDHDLRVAPAQAGAHTQHGFPPARE